MDFLLVLFMATDALLACFSLATKRISISFGARLVIASVGTICLMLSLLFARVLSAIIPQSIFHFASCLVLFIIAILCLFDAGFKKLSASLSNKSQSLSFKLNGLNIILQICADTSQADTDHSGVLSPMEALFLAIPLSIDSLFTGLSISTNYTAALLAFSFVCGVSATFIGQTAGKKFAASQGQRATVCSGFMLLFIAWFKMIFG